MASGKLRRNTPQRRVILEELCRLRSHPTAAELYVIVRRRLPRISLGTIYRNLEVLHEDGVIAKMEFSGTESRFDGNREQHSHVRCTECGRLEDIFQTEQDLPSTHPAELAGYRITGHRLEYFGLCPDCRKSKSLPGSLDNTSH